jgi:hypothetical protein
MSLAPRAQSRQRTSMVRRKGTAMFSRIRDRIAKLEERVAPQNRIFDKPVFLLCGFAVENAIKVFLVYENPNWVSNGRLSRGSNHTTSRGCRINQTSSHAENRASGFCRSSSQVLDSWFRYPLWSGYTKPMGACGKKLILLLGNGWNGPHGGHGQWIIRGPQLGYEKWPSKLRRGSRPRP